MKFHIIATKSQRPLWAKSAFENYQQRGDGHPAFPYGAQSPAAGTAVAGAALREGRTGAWSLSF